MKDDPLDDKSLEATPVEAHESDEVLQALAEQAEAHALAGAMAFTASANPAASQKLYEKWRTTRMKSKVTRAEGMCAVAGVVADFIQFEECPHCRRVLSAQIFALAHNFIERNTDESQGIH